MAGKHTAERERSREKESEREESNFYAGRNFGEVN
ncbi:unnamed protein product [Camellia sinensis]